MMRARGRDAASTAPSSAVVDDESRDAPRRTSGPARARQARIGLTLAAAIVSGWIAIAVVGLFHLDLAATPWPLTIALIAMQTWLSVGLFIVAHDAMHGSLAPGHPAVQRWTGRLCLTLYAGLSFDRLLASHHAHHRAPGTADDPDFDPDHPRAFWPWFVTFMRRHLGARSLAFQSVVAAALVFGFGAPLGNLLMFWAAPSILAALQLFHFGTYRPHRHGPDAFADAHATRSETFPDWLSLMTCSHFGRHHEHHLAPRLPWWRLKRDVAT